MSHKPARQISRSTVN